MMNEWRVCVLVLMLVLPQAINSKSPKKNVINYERVEKENITLQKDNVRLKGELKEHKVIIKNIKKKNTQLISELHVANKKIELKDKIIHNKITSINKSIEENAKGLVNVRKKIESQQNIVVTLTNWFVENGRLTFIGGILILFGLLVEILGAIMVASPALASKQSKIKSLSIRFISKDLMLSNTNEDGVYNFVSFLGSVLLILGFTLQFSGTFLIIPIPLWIKAICAISIIILCLLLVLFFMKQSPEQGFKIKIGIIVFNLKKVFLEPIKNKIMGNLTCSYCLKAIDKEKIYINYYWGENSPGYFTNSPYQVTYGHIECLNLMFYRKKNDQNNKDQEDELENSRRLCSREIFLKEFPDILQFYRDKNEDYERRIGKKAKPYKNEAEHELRLLYKKLRLI